jgi:hypothetical protein
MSLLVQTFNHLNAPVLTKGMSLGASGVSAPPLQIIGSTAGLSAANGSFQDLLGKGQFDYDSAGYLYVCDTTNNRIQRFAKNSSGAWLYDSQCSSLSALGASVNMELVAIDRGRNQIHLGSSAQIAAGNLFGVWDLGLWPNLTTGNRNRSYGTSSASNGAGNLRAPLCLTVVGDNAFACSSAGDYRVIKYNHTTGAILAQKTNSLWMARYVSDGTKVYSGAQATNTELGLWLMNTSTLAGTTRLDSGLPSGVNYTRRNYLVQGAGGDITDLIYHNGMGASWRGRPLAIPSWTNASGPEDLAPSMPDTRRARCSGHKYSRPRLVWSSAAPARATTLLRGRATPRTTTSKAL